MDQNHPQIVLGNKRIQVKEKVLHCYKKPSTIQTKPLAVTARLHNTKPCQLWRL